jgi:hypothetical protein
MLPSQVGAYEEARLRELSQRPNTTVLKVEHDHKHAAWPVAKLRPVLERLAARVVSFDDSVSDFTVRKTCLEDPEILAFKRDHLNFFMMLTDRKMVKEARFRNAVKSLLAVREQVERGQVSEGNDADAMATRSVLAALGTSHVADGA